MDDAFRFHLRIQFLQQIADFLISLVVDDTTERIEINIYGYYQMSNLTEGKFYNSQFSDNKA